MRIAVLILALPVSAWALSLCPAGSRVPVAVLHGDGTANGNTPEARKRSMADSVLRHFDRAPQGVKLFVLPEAALTPWPDDTGRDFRDEAEARRFAYRLPAVGQRLTDPPFSRLAAVARDRGTFIQVGLFEEDGGRVYNVAMVIGPDGTLVAKHRKVNLYTGEERYITPGEHRPTVFDATSVGIGRVGVAICADIYDSSREPHLMEKYRREGIDLFSLSAEWQEAADREKGPTQGWGPMRFFEEVTRYLNNPRHIPARDRYGARLTRREDRRIHVAVSNSTDPVPGAGVAGPDGNWLRSATTARESGWLVGCVPDVRAGAPDGAKNH